MIKKKFLKSRPVCKVTFRVPKEDAMEAKSIHLTGEFNGWNKQEIPMKKLKNGSFTVTLDLEKNNDYQFRYIIDNRKWINEPQADRHVPSGFVGSENSVISV